MTGALFYAKMLSVPILAVFAAFALKMFRQRLKLYKLHLVTVMVLAFFAAMHPVHNLEIRCLNQRGSPEECAVLWATYASAGYGLTFLGLLLLDFLLVESLKRPHAPHTDHAVLLPLKVLIGASVANALYALWHLL